MSATLLEVIDNASTWYNPVRNSTKLRHQIVINKVNELSKLRVNGMRPNHEDVLLRASEETGYSKGTIENIISRNRKG